MSLPDINQRVNRLMLQDDVEGPPDPRRAQQHDVIVRLHEAECCRAWLNMPPIRRFSSKSSTYIAPIFLKNLDRRFAMIKYFPQRFRIRFAIESLEPEEQACMGRNLESYKDFKDRLLAIYWGPSQQHKVRRQFECGRWEREGKLGMSAYFLELARRASMLTPPPSDRDIVSTLKFHLPEFVCLNLVAHPRETVLDTWSYIKRLEDTKLEHKRRTVDAKRLEAAARRDQDFQDSDHEGERGRRHGHQGDKERRDRADQGQGRGEGHQGPARGRQENKRDEEVERGWRQVQFEHQGSRNRHNRDDQSQIRGDQGKARGDQGQARDEQGKTRGYQEKQRGEAERGRRSDIFEHQGDHRDLEFRVLPHDDQADKQAKAKRNKQHGDDTEPQAGSSKQGEEPRAGPSQEHGDKPDSQAGSSKQHGKPPQADKVSLKDEGTQTEGLTIIIHERPGLEEQGHRDQ